MKKRLIITNGYYNIVNIVSTLKTIEAETTIKEEYYNILVIHVDNQNKNNLEFLAKNLYKFNEIKFIYKANKKNLKSTYMSYSEIHEVFLPYITWLKYFNNLNKNTKIVVVDEGTGTYFNNLFYFNNSNDFIIYMLYKNTLDIPFKGTCKAINHNIYKEVLKDVYNLYPYQIKEPCILFISSSYISTTNNEGIDNIVSMLNLLIEKYNLTIYYKLHPREDETIAQEINQKLVNKNKVVFVYTKDILIVEALFHNNNIRICISEHSTSIINSFYLFNIPSFSLYYNPINKYDSTVLSKVLLPNIVTYLNNNYGLTAEEYCNNYVNIVVRNVINKIISPIVVDFNSTFLLKKLIKKCQKRIYIMKLLIFILITVIVAMLIYMYVK